MHKVYVDEYTMFDNVGMSRKWVLEAGGYFWFTHFFLKSFLLITYSSLMNFTSCISP